MTCRGLRRALVAGLAGAGLVAGAVAPAAAQARWGRPFDLAAPQTLDVLAPQLAISNSGAAAAAVGLQDVDVPSSSAGYLSLRAGDGAVAGPTAIAAARQILDLAYDGRTLELLTGAAGAGETCCDSVQAVAVGAGGVPGPPRPLVAGLAGATLGRLITLADAQMLAAVATERGVWVAQSSRGDRFGSQHLLTGPGQMPETVAAVPLGGGASLVAWTAARAGADPRSVSGATGTRRRPPHRARTLVTVARGHRIDEIGVARRGGQATLAWIASWYDRRGAYHSVVNAVDLTPHAQPRTLSPANRLASGLAFAGDPAGDQVTAWESCTVDDACTADAAVRRRGGDFGPARALGGVDAAQAPAVAVGPAGQAVVAWIRGGDPMAASQAAPGRGFGSPVVLSRAGYALDINVAVGRGRQALAAWSQGTLNPSVVGVSGF